MEPGIATRLESMRPAIKREWESRLRGQPALSPMASPDTLVFLMDKTLTQLTTGLRTRSTRGWLHRSVPVIATMSPHCACSLNPLLNYYATGELAIQAVAAPSCNDAEMAKALLFFHALAHREIDALCGVCRCRHEQGCVREMARSGFTAAPVLRARRSGTPRRSCGKRD